MTPVVIEVGDVIEFAHGDDAPMFQRLTHPAAVEDWNGKLRSRVRGIYRQQPAVERTCDWTEDDDGVWHTACGTAWCSEAGGAPIDHRMHFCYHCGATLIALARETETTP